MERIRLQPAPSLGEVAWRVVQWVWRFPAAAESFVAVQPRYTSELWRLEGTRFARLGAGICLLTLPVDLPATLASGSSLTRSRTLCFGSEKKR